MSDPRTDYLASNDPRDVSAMCVELADVRAKIANAWALNLSREQMARLHDRETLLAKACKGELAKVREAEEARRANGSG